ncbi:MAG: efflux RND transporter periplasmic adaptor subunit [Acidiferrobacter sp.]
MMTRFVRRASSAMAVFVLCLWTVPALAVRVTLSTVKVTTWKHTVAVMGQVKSIGQVTLTAPMTGRVVGPFLPAGVVAAGAVIARIDPPGLAAQIRAAKAQAAYAHIALQRSRQLFHDGVVARASLESSFVAWRQAAAHWRALQAQQVDQSLTAPFAGNLNYLIAPGGVVTAGTAIATLNGRGQPWVQVLVPPPTALQLSVGSPVGIHVGTWQGLGRVRSIGRSARQSGLVVVVIAVPKDAPLLPGEWLPLRLRIPQRRAFTVPIAAVVMHGARALVFTDDGGKAHAVPVTVLGTSRQRAWVRGALKAGERVVVSGDARLSEHSSLDARP